MSQILSNHRIRMPKVRTGVLTFKRDWKITIFNVRYWTNKEFNNSTNYSKLYSGFDCNVWVIYKRYSRQIYVSNRKIYFSVVATIFKFLSYSQVNITNVFQFRQEFKEYRIIFFSVRDIDKLWKLSILPWPKLSDSEL